MLLALRMLLRLEFLAVEKLTCALDRLPCAETFVVLLASDRAAFAKSVAMAAHLCRCSSTMNCYDRRAACGAAQDGAERRAASLWFLSATYNIQRTIIIIIREENGAPRRTEKLEPKAILIHAVGEASNAEL